MASGMMHRMKLREAYQKGYRGAQVKAVKGYEKRFFQLGQRDARVGLPLGASLGAAMGHAKELGANDSNVGTDVETGDDFRDLGVFDGVGYDEAEHDEADDDPADHDEADSDDASFDEADADEHDDVRI
jgi:hypothetical protein